MKSYFSKLARTSIAVVGVSFLSFSGLSHAIDYSGTCTGTVPAAGSPHRLVGNCTVPTGQAFTIEAGAELDGQNNTLSVSGTFNATQTIFTDTFFRANNGGSVAADDVDLTGGQFDYRAGSMGSVTNSTLDATSSCAVLIDDMSATVTGNTFTNVSRAVCVSGTSVSSPAAPLIDNNTISSASSSGGIDVNEAAQPTITNNAIQVRSGTGIEFDGTAAGTVTGNTITFAPDVASNRIGIELNNNASPVVQANTIEDDVFRPDEGLVVLVSAVSSTQVTGNTVACSGTDAPLRVGPGVFADAFPGNVSGNIFGCDLSQVSVQLSGTLTGDTTLGPLEGQTAFTLTSTLTVPDGFNLSIPAGISLSGSQFLSVSGTLTATQATFTDTFFRVLNGGSATADDVDLTGGQFDFRAGSAGSVTNSTLEATSSCAIFIDDMSATVTGNTFTNVSRAVCVSGTSVSSPAAPLIDNNTISSASSSGGIDVNEAAQPTITNNAIQVRSGTGIEFDGTAAGTVTGNTITFAPDVASNRIGIELNNNASPVVQANTIEDDVFRPDEGLVVLVSAVSSTQVTGNTVACSGTDAPLRVGPGVFADAFPGNVSGNIFGCDLSQVSVQLSGTLTGDTTLGPLEGQTAFTLTSTLTVPDGFNLSIPAGISLSGSQFLSVSGTLTATQATFTDTFFRVLNGGSATADDVDLTGGQFDFRAGSAGSVTNSTLEATSSCAIFIDDMSATVTGNTFTNVSRAVCVSGTSVSSPAAPLIDNNTISSASSSGGIDVNEAAQPTITNNAIQMRSGTGIDFAGTAAGTVTDNTITFAPDVASNRIGIELNNNASPVVQANTIEDDVFRADEGLVVLVSAVSSTQVTGNTVACSGADAPLRVGPGVFADAFPGDVSGNIFGCDLSQVSVQLSGTLTGDTTLGPLEGQSAFELIGTLTVPDGFNLSIPAGISLSGNRTLSVSGTLTATQATFTDIFFQVNNGGSAAADDVDLSGGQFDFRASSAGSVTNSTLEATSSCAIFIDDMSATVTGNTFTNVSRAVCVSGTSVSSPAAPLIDNNTISSGSTSGGIDVGEAAQPVITNNAIQVRSGSGIDFAGTAAGTVTGNTITFAPDVASNRIGIELNNNASPVVQANTVEDDVFRSDVGLVLFMSGLSDAQVIDNSICATGSDVPIRFGPNVFADDALSTISGNTLVCGAGTGFQLAGTVTENATIAVLSGNGQFQLSSTLTVNAGVRLAVDPGIAFTGANNSLTVNGVLEVDGAVFENVFLDFRAGSAGTISNSQLTGPTFGTAVSVATSSPSFIGNTFSGMSKVFDLNGNTNVLIQDNTFLANGIVIDVEGPTSLSVTSGNTFDGNTESIRFLTADGLFSAYPTDFSSNTFSGTAGSNVVRMPGSIGVSGTMPVPPVPYFNPNNLRITSGADVLIQAGTAITSSTSRQIIVDAGSRLVALGTAEFPVLFTDFNPKDGSRWSGLVIRDESSILQGCVVEFSNSDGIRLESASIPITNCRISDNSGDGLDLTGDSVPTVTGSSIVSNIGAGVRSNLSTAPGVGQTLSVQNSSIFSNGDLGVDNLSSAFDIDAISNYWGDDSGPLDDSDDRATGGLYNPTGAGQRVSDNVFYDPWIRIGPTQEGVMIPVSGGGQTGTVGEILPLPFVIEVQSTLGTPLEGIEVIFSVVAGDASVVGSQPVITDAAGRASATIQLGLTPGEVVLAATARDVNSPLASFMAEADGPCLVTMKVESLALVVDDYNPGQPGDVNGDGRVNNQDAALLAGVLDGLVAEDSPLVNAWEAADINGDAQTNSGDVLTIQGVQIGMVGQ